jgi:hypothetical protein
MVGNKYAQLQDIAQITSLQNNISFMYNCKANDACKGTVKGGEI